MATYASKTNPFLKSDEINCENEKSSRLEAPGMAQLKSFEEETDLSNDEKSLTISTNLPLAGESEGDVKVCINTEKLVTIDLNCNQVNEGEKSPNIDGLVQLIPNDSTSPVVQSNVSTNAKTGLGMGSNLINDAIETEVSGDVTEGNSDGVEFEFEVAPMESDNRRHQHIELIKKLRLQLRDLERYAYERGELDEVPPSVLNERQSVIIDALRNRLSLNIGATSIEKLELDELKKQVDKEINDLIDPLVTKEHLLGQLKTQLTDLERYIAHLHGTISKIHLKKNCSCSLHGCSSSNGHITDVSSDINAPNIMSNDELPKTSKLIRSLLTQLVCSDLKIQDNVKKNQALEKPRNQSVGEGSVITKQPRAQDNAAWSLHIDKVVLATDSLVNLYNLEPQYQRTNEKIPDASLVESVVRRQLVPALRDTLSYGLIDPNMIPRPTSYAALLFDPYHILSSLTCFPGSQKSTELPDSSKMDKFHVWCVIEDYYKFRNEPGFRNSSIKKLSQSFNLEPTMEGPIKVTSKQALLIAVDDIIETLAKCKPNGPESHFRAFIYTALNRCKLSTWLRLIFRNKSIVRKYYHDFSFVSQPDKFEKLLKTTEPLNQLDFELATDVESIEQFVSAF